MIPLPHNPIKDILAVISITAIATGAFIKYVQYYEKKYGSGNKRDRK
jgi:Tfp pilus assembly major pilin PilA